MQIDIKTKIWLTVLSIVMMFALFTLIYFPARQGKDLLRNYNDEVQNLANTVALGVNIALNEQNYDGINAAMSYVRNNPAVRFVSLVKTDSTQQSDGKITTKHEILQTYPEAVKPNPDVRSSDSLLVKKAPFVSSDLSGYILLGVSLDSINKAKTDIFYTSLLISGLILAIGLLLGLWLARNISVPIAGLRNAARRVSEGDLSQVSIRHSTDEVGDLALAFNKMLTDLSSAREALNKSNKELSASNQTLNQTLVDLKATQNQLVQSEKMASLGELTAGIAHEIQNPLNFVNNFSEVSIELADELKNEVEKLPIPDETKETIRDLSIDLLQNQEKIMFHGKRADAIVKGMLQHSRKNTGQKEMTDINTLCDEYVRLSYHGLRAKDKSFNADFKTCFDNSIGKISVVPQDIGRVLLNLLNNAFYAVNEKKKTAGTDYKPIVSVSTEKKNNEVEIIVQDNGSGIPQSVCDKIFQPFFTTKPTGSGTGLGLSLSYDIVTKQHGGTIQVSSQENSFTKFTVTIPA